MKHSKRVAMILAGVLCVGMLAACGGGASSESASSSTASTATESSATSGEGGGAASDVTESGLPIISDPSQMPKITVFKSVNDQEPEDPNENLWMKKATEDTGVTFKWIVVPSASSAERVQMMLANNDLPDVFWGGITRGHVLQYMDTGMFMPVEDLVDQYMPNLSSIYEQRPEYKALAYAPDGHIYGFPRVEEMNGLVLTPGSVYVYKPWLDTLGLSLPTTLDEWTAMLYAIKDGGDLNGNGEQDEWAISWDYAEAWDNIFAWVSGCYGTPDVTNGKDAMTNHLFEKDGKIGYAPLEESYQKTAELFHQFYADGLLNPDSFAPTGTGTSLHRQKTQQDVAMLGTFMAWGRDGNITNPEVKAGYVAQPRIEGPNGKSGYRRNTSELSSTTLAMITENCQSPDIVARFVDYCMLPDKSVTANWGAEDFYYVRGDDGVLRWDVDENGTMVYKNGLSEIWQMRNYSTIGGPNIVLNDYYDTVVEYPLDAADLYGEQVAGGKEELLRDLTSVSPMVWFLPEEQAQIDQLLPQINNVVDATIQRWIIDGGADTGFDQFRAELEAAGVNTFLETYQKAYDRYLENMA